MPVQYDPQLYGNILKSAQETADENEQGQLQTMNMAQQMDAFSRLKQLRGALQGQDLSDVSPETQALNAQGLGPEAISLAGNEATTSEAVQNARKTRMANDLMQKFPGLVQGIMSGLPGETNLGGTQEENTPPQTQPVPNAPAQAPAATPVPAANGTAPVQTPAFMTQNPDAVFRSKVQQLKAMSAIPMYAPMIAGTLSNVQDQWAANVIPRINQQVDQLAGSYSMEKGGFNKIAEKVAEMIPPELQDNPLIQKRLDEIKEMKPNTQFNLAGPQMYATSRMLSTLISKADQTKADYEKVMNPFINLKGVEQSPTWGTAAGDVSLINQLSLAEFGGYKPSEAEYAAFGKGFTPAQYLQKAISWADQGNVLPEAVRQHMAEEVDRIASIKHNEYKKEMQSTGNRVQNIADAQGMNLTPDQVVSPGGAYAVADSIFNNQKPPQSNPATKYSAEQVSAAKAYEQLPANSPYRSAQRDASMKAVLGQ